MTPEKALLDAVASLESADVLRLAIEEAGVHRTNAARDLAHAIRRAVRRPDDALARQAVERAVRVHGDALVALMSLRAAQALNIEFAKALSCQYGFTMDEAEQQFVNRRAQARLDARRFVEA